MFDIFNQVYLELIRTLTGQLFTEKQVQLITKHTVGRHLAEFFPEDENEKNARERVEEARVHISKAGDIISHMQAELDLQTNQLDTLLNEIELKKEQANKFAQLAATNEAKFSAFKEQMAESLKAELVAQSNEGKNLRRAASAFIWLLTLVVGAALGTYFKEIVQWLGALFA
ncbi:TPA: hypothetical protein ACVOZB_004497 [Vibrio diabolicus]|uniref:hypothetical protein n=1 Tax=Vibrio harveyi group TaxID=717610 RepID=UPI000CE3D327|nr:MULTISPECIES: hypothetical protein [Vibrio harveyi group]ELB2184811.1 hypothetical protein [Vibrio parahaemolyticus]MCX8855147.1 hypothetical protein [Vibrio parahaemolyticus]TOJ08832.1 hypothetical protein CGI45_24975 [Vibrio parahaemolyticus]HAS6868497.1 hypothetical protein [Vibrio parahaemolyticus]HAV1516169.1 hypothetical protein [Vibrio parahaemolyticus]